MKFRCHLYSRASCFYYPNVQDAFHSAGELQATLQEVDVPVVAAEECQRALRSEGLGRR